MENCTVLLTICASVRRPRDSLDSECASVLVLCCVVSMTSSRVPSSGRPARARTRRELLGPAAARNRGRAARGSAHRQHWALPAASRAASGAASWHGTRARARTRTTRAARASACGRRSCARLQSARDPLVVRGADSLHRTDAAARANHSREADRSSVCYSSALYFSSALYYSVM